MVIGVVGRPNLVDGGVALAEDWEMREVVACLGQASELVMVMLLSDGLG